MYVKEGAFVQGLDMFDAKAFGITPAEAKLMDPQQRMLLEVGYDALHRAGYTKGDLIGTRVGVFVGAQPCGFAKVLAETDVKSSPYNATGMALSVISNRVSFALGLEGPSLTVDTACSSALVAMNIATQSLQNGECDVALVAGVGVLVDPDIYIATCSAGMLSPTGRCHPFDAGADGYCRGEGCGAIVLKRTNTVKADVDAASAALPCYGIIRSCVVNQDGRSARLTAPNGLAQQAMHRRALELATSAGISRSDVRMIETHGTGTSLGDPIEVGALKAVYGNDENRKHDLVLGAVKSNIGHLEAAAGIAGLIKLVLSLGHRTCPRNLHFKTLNPEIDLDGLQALFPSESSVRLDIGDGSGRMVGGVSSFGFGGTNAHVLVENVEPFLQVNCGKRDGGYNNGHVELLYGERVVYEKQQFSWMAVKFNDPLQLITQTGGQSVNSAPEALSKWMGHECDARIQMIQEHIQKIAEACTGETDIDVDEPLLDVGLDSLSIVEFRLALQVEFGVKVQTESLLKNPATSQLTQVIAQKIIELAEVYAKICELTPNQK
jgi:acyl transferase domain-containing protein/acyl carrier protein